MTNRIVLGLAVPVLHPRNASAGIIQASQEAAATGGVGVDGNKSLMRNGADRPTPDIQWDPQGAGQRFVEQGLLVLSQGLVAKARKSRILGPTALKCEIFELLMRRKLVAVWFSYGLLTCWLSPRVLRSV